MITTLLFTERKGPKGGGEAELQSPALEAGGHHTQLL